MAKLIDLRDEAVEEVAVVADADERAVEVLERLLEDVLRLEVKMVGRFIKDEEIDGLKQEFHQGQAGALAAREHLHLLRAGLAAKHKRAEQVANLIANLALRYIVYGLINGQVLVEQRGLILCEIAYLHVVAERQRALVLQLAHNTFDERGLAFAVAAHEGHFVAALDGQANVGEYTLLAESLAHAVHHHGVLARARRGRKLQAQGRGVLLIYLNEFQFLEHLDTALHLESLGVSSLEAFDEILRLLNHLLLLLPLLHLLFAALGAQLQVVGIVHLVVVDTSHRHLDGARGDIVHEFAVVANDDHGLAIADEEILEPADTLDVQVVGRLVKEQHVGILQQHLGQLNAHTPSARKLRCLAIEIRALKA